MDRSCQTRPLGGGCFNKERFPWRLLPAGGARGPAVLGTQPGPSLSSPCRGPESWVKAGLEAAGRPHCWESIPCYIRRQGPGGSGFQQLVSSSCLGPLPLLLPSASHSMISGGAAAFQSSAYCSPWGQGGEKRGCSQDSAPCGTAPQFIPRA